MDATADSLLCEYEEKMLDLLIMVKLCVAVQCVGV